MITKKYLIDVNLPRYFSLWAGGEYEHVVNINDCKNLEQEFRTSINRPADTVHKPS